MRMNFSFQVCSGFVFPFFGKISWPSNILLLLREKKIKTIRESYPDFRTYVQREQIRLIDDKYNIATKNYTIATLTRQTKTNENIMWLHENKIRQKTLNQISSNFWYFRSLFEIFQCNAVDQKKKNILHKIVVFVVIIRT